MITQPIVPLVAAIIGGVVAHFLSAWRDRINKRRDKKVEYLIDAYRRLEGCSNRSFSGEKRDAVNEFKAMMVRLESALADIQLFGSPSQVTLAQTFANEFAARRTGNFDDLLEDLRHGLRKELGLDEVARGILHLRYTEER